MILVDKNGKPALKKKRQAPNPTTTTTTTTTTTAVPVDGGWSAWFADPSCPSNCSYQAYTAIRECNNPPVSGSGNPCSGNSSEIKFRPHAECASAGKLNVIYVPYRVANDKCYIKRSCCLE